jgi:hypothetical protein
MNKMNKSEGVGSFGKVHRTKMDVTTIVSTSDEMKSKII